MSAHPFVPVLLDRLAAAGGSPRLTWYGADGERVELSGAVLGNWVAKTTNLLVEELDVAPGTRVRLDLPAHWRAVTWALAAWRAGGCVVLGDTGPADVVVTDRPQEHPGADVVAVSLPALARRFDGDLPAGAIDAAAAVMTYGDVLGWAPDADPGAPALDDGAAVVRHADLPAWAVGSGSAVDDGARVLLEAGPGRTADLAAVLRQTLGVLSADGSVVVLSAGTVAELAADPARRTRLLDGERVTSGA